MEIFAKVLTIPDVERRFSSSDVRVTASKKKNFAMKIFAKLLTILNVERRFSSSDVRVPALPSCEGCHVIVLQVEDDAGNSWNFGCKIQPGVVPKLLIVSGWIQFVRSKDLRSGDIVVLYKEEGANYKIQVKRS